MTRRRMFLLAVFAVAIATSTALARPGGGESFSGGGGHGGGGSSGDSGGEIAFELIYWGIQLVFYYPAIGIPLLALIVGTILWSAYKQRQNRDWDSGPPIDLATDARKELRAPDTAGLVGLDPDFSQVVFEDFAFRLFSAAHRARTNATALATVAPYVSEAARLSLAQRTPVDEAVVQVIVGALRVVRIDNPGSAGKRSTPGQGVRSWIDNPGSAGKRSTPGQGVRSWIDVPTGAGVGDMLEATPDSRVRISVEFEANVSTAAHTYYSVETWSFSRDAARTSKPPGVARTFPCPNCGAPWQSTGTGTQQCASCSQIVDNGRFDWVVEDIHLRSIDERAPSVLSEVEERGTNLPTYKAPDRDEQWERLIADDPDVSETAFERRLAMIYDRLNKAWTANDLTPIRGLVSDGLYDYLSYWIATYKRQGFHNQLVGMRITAVEYAKVSRDRWYDAITIRIWGTGKDFIVRTKSGKIVRGSKRVDRRYSEYWTLIRSAMRKGIPKAVAACGNCGAPLAITMAGACEHCGSYLAGGDFDWVVSKIEQDDTYRG